MNWGARNFYEWKLNPTPPEFTALLERQRAERDHFRGTEAEKLALDQRQAAEHVEFTARWRAQLERK